MRISSVPTRLSLIERARLRDEDAWRELVDLYSPLIVVWCQHCRAGREMTADVLQDVFATVARALDTFSSPGYTGAFRGWLWTITKNKLRDAVRRDARQVQGVGGSSAQALLAQFPDPLEISDNEPSQSSELYALMSRGLSQIEATFQPTTWQAFWRSVVDAQPTDQVARELNMSPASVRQARSRVLRRLRQQLSDDA